MSAQLPQLFLWFKNEIRHDALSFDKSCKADVESKFAYVVVDLFNQSFSFLIVNLSGTGDYWSKLRYYGLLGLVNAGRCRLFQFTVNSDCNWTRYKLYDALSNTQSAMKYGVLYYKYYDCSSFGISRWFVILIRFRHLIQQQNSQRG